ncbi:hypothetical protein OKW39_004562 [Paraburkholderia sp. MM6662-R1]
MRRFGLIGLATSSVSGMSPAQMATSLLFETRSTRSSVTEMSKPKSGYRRSRRGSAGMMIVVPVATRNDTRATPFALSRNEAASDLALLAARRSC